MSFDENTFECSTSSQEMLAERSRDSLYIENNGAEAVWLRYGEDAVVGTGIKIDAGGWYEPYNPTSESVHVIAESGTPQLYYVQD